MEAVGALDKDITYLKGVGPQKAQLLEEHLGLKKFGDLLFFFPTRYLDRSRFWTIAEVEEGMPFIQLKGKIHQPEIIGEGKKRRLRVAFSDGTGTIELVWFQYINSILKHLKPGEQYVVFGRPAFYRFSFNIAHPEIELVAQAKQEKIEGFIQPVYPVPEKLKARGIDNQLFIRAFEQILPALTSHPLSETLPPSVIQAWNFPPRKEAIKNMHRPPSFRDAEAARRRFKFEELFFFQYNLVRQNKLSKKLQNGIVFAKIGDHFNHFYHHQLPFELTNAQKRVLKEIRNDVRQGAQMNRLVQGDVGSGKTVVALLTMLMAIDNGYQACLMAPTEILARQHFIGISALLEGSEISIGFLSGSTKQGERKKLLSALIHGELHILIGTHALIEPQVQFKALGLAVIDEQHRFGVEQRAKLWEKSSPPPHILVMTATPIPRTLALSLYGHLDQSLIDELPPGRKPIKTLLLGQDEQARLFYFIRQQIQEGRQIYMVYPLIEESEKSDMKDLYAGFEAVAAAFPVPEFHVSIVHGKLKAEEKELEMKRFVEGHTQIMVSTTVIEVGVNVPNASVMVIENAEKFGLSQLHQLRGRVGRGADQSYCILVHGEKLGNDARKRLRTLVETQDGFKIAEVDFELRGPGDLDGTAQSGFAQLAVANLMTDQDLLIKARNLVIEWMENTSKFQTEIELVDRIISKQSHAKNSFRNIS